MNHQRLKYYQQAAEYLSQLVCNDELSDQAAEAREYMAQLLQEMDEEERSVASDTLQSVAFRRANRLN